MMRSFMFQEGLLDITLLFSDGQETSLRDIDPAQYYLTVDTLDPQVIAFAPIIGSKDTRVIAVGVGSGPLLRVSLELADDCHEKTDEPLATATANVKVEFEATPVFKDSSADRNLLRERGGRRRKYKEKREKVGNIKSVNMGDLSEMFSNVALGDDNSRHSQSGSPVARVFSPHSPHQPVTPLEVGMYILLGVFCIAIAVFMASCFVYASKHTDGSRLSPLERKSESVQNAHDWVWLGRQTLDKSSLATSGSRDLLDTNVNSIRSGDSRGLLREAGRSCYPPHRSVNITHNPCGAPDTLYGFVNKRGLNVSAFSSDVYAELPRKRQTRQTSPLPGQYHEESRALLHQSQRMREMRESPPSRRSSRSSRPSVNSATYTRRNPVIPSQDILPVGYPVFSSQPEDQTVVCEGFQNPWEALQMYRSKQDQPEDFSQSESPLRLDLHLDQQEPELRQSPASGLPPYSQEATEVSSPSSVTRGEYVTLNPDINKATPPRKGARRMFSDPFNVSDCEAPPVSSDLLSPSHVFTSQEEEGRAEDNESDTSVSAAEDNCSSVCSVDSGELEMLDDLPCQSHIPAASPAGSLSRQNVTCDSSLPDLVDNRKISPSTSRDLNDVPLGSLDYEQLMGYFESLKESAA